MKCPHCEIEFDDPTHQTKFCPKCGGDLKVIESTADPKIQIRINAEVPFFKRILAYIVDLVLVVVLFGTLEAFLQVDYSAHVPNFLNTYVVDYPELVLGWVRLSYLNWIGFLYFFLFIFVMKGNTPGKKIFQIDVIDVETLEKPKKYFWFLVDAIEKANVGLLMGDVLATSIFAKKENLYRLTQLWSNIRNIPKSKK